MACELLVPNPEERRRGLGSEGASRGQFACGQRCWRLWSFVAPLGHALVPTQPAAKSRKEKGPRRVLEQLADVVLMKGNRVKRTCGVSALLDPFIPPELRPHSSRDRSVFQDPDAVALVVRNSELARLGYLHSIPHHVTIPFLQCSDSARSLVETKIQRVPRNTEARQGTSETPTSCTPIHKRELYLGNRLDVA
ncbi:LOW QUALITY PROTEIN: SPEG neighbor protein [Sorex fumeus]|uniref:LOW QUALITY PROTEIN: SPEG neighbor protein n=1 Tax=Sorex fumeus TaxID=62283 RepID=UPI0024ACEF0C|nr:LOW QUALITY PROTEIN: SPEG neighbor protein [Sorex fumeus]